ncbi:hypothetical protein LY78DRAFT_651203 [Colletotrichum sublineola]|nr:hypothetical protein LY78DRAFT_651203 [Colletotrichum sublineola]
MAGIVCCFCVPPSAVCLLACLVFDGQQQLRQTRHRPIHPSSPPAPPPPFPCSPKTNNTHNHTHTRVTASSSSHPILRLSLATRLSLTPRFFPSPYPPAPRDRLSSPPGISPNFPPCRQSWTLGASSPGTLVPSWPSNRMSHQICLPERKSFPIELPHQNID